MRSYFDWRPASFLALASFVLLAGHGAAQDREDAERLLKQRQFALARDAASAAIATGAHDASELAPLYRVLALASASVAESNDAAGRAFLWLLALDPEFRLGDEWPVEVRSPYMEARGAVSMHTNVLSATGQLSQDEKAWLVTLDDPFQLAARVRLRARFAGQTEYVETVRMPAPELAFPLPDNREDRALEYSISLLDEVGNRIWQHGSDEDPEIFPYAVPTPVRVAQPPPLVETSDEPRGRNGFVVGATTALVVGIAAGAVGGFQHAERQRLAKRWNSGECEGTGATRAEVCREERRGIDQAQRVAGTAYAVAGVSLITSLLLFVAAPHRPSSEARRALEARLQCGDGPGKWGVSCATRF